MRTATLCSRSGAALGNASYPTTLGAGEEMVYFPCLPPTWVYRATVTRDAGGGSASTVKLQVTADTPDPLTIGPVGGPGLVVTATGPRTLKLTQQTGTSQALGHRIVGTALELLLPTDAAGQPSGTPAAAAAYVASTGALAAFTVTAVGAGILGETYRAQAVPMVPVWVDARSTNKAIGTVAVEHSIDPGAGGATKAVDLELAAQGFRAVRALATCAAAPAPGDAATVTCPVPG